MEEVGKGAKKQRRRTGPGHREGLKYRRSKGLCGGQEEKVQGRQVLSSLWKVSLTRKVRLGICFWQGASSFGILL